MFVLGLQQPGEDATVVDVIWSLAIVVVAVGVYFTPTILAFTRGVSSPWSVTVINVFLGWTFVGWVVALAMAMRTPTAKAA